MATAVLRKIVCIATLCALASGCSSEPLFIAESPPLAESEALAATTSRSGSLALTDASHLFTMTTTGIGPVELGMSLEDVEAAIEPEHQIGPVEDFGEWINQYPVIVDGAPVFWMGVDVETGLVDVLSTSSPDVVFAGQLHPMMTVGNAAELVGEPTVRFNSVGRAFTAADFPEAPEQFQIELGPAADGSSPASYPDGAEFGDDPVTATSYNPDAVISMVMIFSPNF